MTQTLVTQTLVTRTLVTRMVVTRMVVTRMVVTRTLVTVTQVAFLATAVSLGSYRVTEMEMAMATVMVMQPAMMDHATYRWPISATAMPRVEVCLAGFSADIPATPFWVELVMESPTAVQG
ncbi:MAG: hypothetical protein MK106_05535 [Mariniblastus sp.]|nr:hypothetical protein [Mariniblastus sp.]